MAVLKLVAEICVSPQVTDSRIASWMNVNCSCMCKDLHQVALIRECELLKAISDLT